MKKFQVILITPILVLLILFIGNSSIRVSNNSEGSIGIFEEIFLGRSFFSLLQPPYSENYKHWNAASEGANTVADILIEYGKSLINDEKLESTRLEAIEISDVAYINAKSVDLEYLRESNNEFPEMFSTKLTPALKLWSEGLKERDDTKLTEGIKFYNEFLQWMQSKNRSDFNKMR